MTNTSFLISMMQIYNIESKKDFRRELRRNMTEPEKQLWFALRNRQFYMIKFRRQYSVGVYILDFYAPEIRLGIEIDGDSHAEQVVYDRERTKYLEGLDIKIIRYTNRDIMENIDGVLLDLAMKLGYLH
ncbi:MAG: endonuclease domain-containing protein [Candidatus Gracilibacteria bacterium]